MPATVGIPPAITEETAPFWTAAADGRLLVEHCDACGADSFPPRGMCRTCRSRDVGWVEVTGPGTVYSYTVNHQRWLPDLEVPYAIVLVEFADHPGVRVVGRIRGLRARRRPHRHDRRRRLRARPRRRVHPELRGRVMRVARHAAFRRVSRGVNLPERMAGRASARRRP